MIKNFKQLFAAIFVFLFSSVYITNINTFACQINLSEISSQPVSSTNFSFDFAPTKLKSKLDNWFEKLKLIHSELNQQINLELLSEKEKLSLICFYLHDLLPNEDLKTNPELYVQFSRTISSLTLYYYGIYLENIELELDRGWVNGFDFLYSISDENYTDLSQDEIDNILIDFNLDQIFAFSND